MYMARFRDASQTLYIARYSGFIHPKINDVELKGVMEVTRIYVKDTKENNIGQAKNKYIEAFKEVCPPKGAAPKHYYSLLSELQNDKLKGHVTFPKTVVKDFYMLNK